MPLFNLEFFVQIRFFSYYSKSMKGINIKLDTFAYYDKTHLSDKGYNSDMNIFGVMPLFNLDFFFKISFFSYYSKSIKDINMKLGTFAYNEAHLSDKGYNSEIIIFGVMPLLNLDFFVKIIVFSYYSKSIEGINKKLRTFVYYDKTHLSDKGYNSEINIFEVFPLFNLDFFVKIRFFPITPKVLKVSI